MIAEFEKRQLLEAGDPTLGLIRPKAGRGRLNPESVS